MFDVQPVWRSDHDAIGPLAGKHRGEVRKPCCGVSSGDGLRGSIGINDRRQVRLVHYSVDVLPTDQPGAHDGNTQLSHSGAPPKHHIEPNIYGDRDFVCCTSLRNMRRFDESRASGLGREKTKMTVMTRRDVLRTGTVALLAGSALGRSSLRARAADKVLLRLSAPATPTDQRSVALDRGLRPGGR